jgi:hypothetical protein
MMIPDVPNHVVGHLFRPSWYWGCTWWRMFTDGSLAHRHFVSMPIVFPDDFLNARCHISMPDVFLVVW